MEKKLLLEEDDGIPKVKEIGMTKDARKLKMVLGGLSWKILTALSEEEIGISSETGHTRAERLLPHKEAGESGSHNCSKGGDEEGSKSEIL